MDGEARWRGGPVKCVRPAVSSTAAAGPAPARAQAQPARLAAPSYARPPPAGMVALLQKVLQVYAQVQLGGSSAQQQQQQGGSASDALLNDLLAADEATWGAVIRQRAKEAEIRCGVGGGGRTDCGGCTWVTDLHTRRLPPHPSHTHPKHTPPLPLQRGGVHGGAAAAHGGRGAGPALGLLRAARAGAGAGAGRCARAVPSHRRARSAQQASRCLHLRPPRMPTPDAHP